MDEQVYIKPSAAAKRLDVSRQAIYKWIREGKLEVVKFGENAVRIPLASLEAFEEERKAATVQHGDVNKKRVMIPTSG
jgi:excisionase family DNA binding protein